MKQQKSIEERIDRLVEILRVNNDAISVSLGCNNKKGINGDILRTEIHSMSHMLNENNKSIFINTFKSYQFDLKNFIGDKSVIIFLDKDNIIDVIGIKLYIPTQIIENREELIRLAESIRSVFKRHLVIALDNREVKMFNVKDSIIEGGNVTLFNKNPQRIKSKTLVSFGMRKLFNYRRNVVNNHLRNISNLISKYVHQYNPIDIIIVGHKDLVHLLSKYLSISIKDKIKGIYISEVKITTTDIKNKLEKVHVFY